MGRCYGRPFMHLRPGGHPFNLHVKARESTEGAHRLQKVALDSSEGGKTPMPSCRCQKCGAHRDPKLTRSESGARFRLVERERNRWVFAVEEPCPDCAATLVVLEPRHRLPTPSQ